MSGHGLRSGLSVRKPQRDLVFDRVSLSGSVCTLEKMALISNVATLLIGARALVRGLRGHRGVVGAKKSELDYA